MPKINEMPQDRRPRERLLSLGAASLGDEELLAVVLGRGSRNNDVLSLSARLLSIIDSRNGNLSASDLSSESGIGSAKAAAIMAALEFARRRIRPHGVKIRSAKDVVPLLSHLANRKQEHFLTVSLNGAHEVIATRVVTVGLANSTQIHPREVFADAISDRACAIIVAHNHPSGDLTPSPEDVAVTERLTQAGELLGIRLLDHVVFSENGFFSFAEAGMMGRR